MAFQKVSFNRLAPFNSAASSELLDKYDSHVNAKLVERASQPQNRTFFPSAFRCNRRSWFKLRGVEPDGVSEPDRVLEFAAEIGTACHRILQTNLREALGDNWIDVGSYLQTLELPGECKWESRDDGLETLVSMTTPPVRFACDGLIRLNDSIYLLEIKSSEYGSWNDLTDPKQHHIDQVNCYATLLQVDSVLFIYIDRQYGGLKCYEHRVSEGDRQSILDRFVYVMSMVDKNLAPEGLPVGDHWCSPSYCPYHKTCQQY